MLFVSVEANYCNPPLSTDGRKPKDTLDAACQRNILCLNALSDPCPCTAQYLSDLLHINVSTATINETYDAYRSCLKDDHKSVPDRYYLGGTTAGLNYLTLWDSAYIIKAYNNVFFYSIATNDYPVFTTIAYEHAENIWHFLPYNRSTPQSILWIESGMLMVVMPNDSSILGFLDIQILGDALTPWKNTIDILTIQYTAAAAASDDWYHQYNDCNDDLDTMQGWYVLAWILIIVIFCSIIGGLIYHRHRKAAGTMRSEAELAAI